MVVVLAAIWYYRTHIRKQEEDAEEANNNNEQEHHHVNYSPRRQPPRLKQHAHRARVPIAKRPPQKTEEDLSERLRLSEHFQRAESFRRTSSDLLKTALSCGHNDTTTLTTTTDEEEPPLQPDSIIMRNTNDDKDDDDDVVPPPPPVMTPPASSFETLSIDPEVFRRDIRDEWVDAVFGNDFYRFGFPGSKYTPPRQGCGLAGIPGYVAYSAKIPINGAGKRNEGEKVGITLSKIAIGLYVRHVEPGSEACAAGVLEGSVLVDINGMGMLAEPSRHALERLWQYEGHFSSENSAVSEDGTASSSQSSGGSPIIPETSSSTSGPIALKLIKNGQLYTIMFLSNPPFGISWAPCGNFALVQRSYAFAQKAGVRRGCIVAAVNGRSLRELDHEGAAQDLRELFANGEKITLSLVYTPAAARSSHYEKENNSVKSPPPPGKRKVTMVSQEGVEVRVHPLEYSIGSFLSCANGVQNNMRRNNKVLTNGGGGGVAELAIKVAAGQIEAPTGIKRSSSRRSTSSGAALSPTQVAVTKKQVSGTAAMRMSKVYGPCPTLPKDEVVNRWDAMNALAYCVTFCSASYDEDSFVALADLSWSRESDILQNLAERKDACEIVGAYLIQFVSVLCLSDDSTGTSTQMAQAKFNAAAKRGKDITRFLLNLAGRNDDFCQSLYFLLRSFIAALEGQKKPRDEDDNSENRVSLLQTLDLLHSAQQQLTDQVAIDAAQLFPVNEEDNGHTDQDASVLPAVSNDDSDDLLASADSTDSSDQMRSKKKKSKSVLRMFRKKSSKQNGTDRAQETVKDVPRDKQPPGSPRRNVLSNGGKVKKQYKEGTAIQTAVRHQPVHLSSLFDNMSRFLGELDSICDTIERSLLKSVSQKIADWALQPWSASKETALADVTEGMREGLHRLRRTAGETEGIAERLPLLNPTDSSELLVSVDSKECYILPSAHFPLLLTFDVNKKPSAPERQNTDSILQEEKLYRTRVEVVALRGSVSPRKNSQNGSAGSTLPSERSYFVQGAVAGTVKESGRSTATEQSKTHTWENGNVLTFDIRSTWGAPRTASLRVLSACVGGDGQDQVAVTDDSGRLHYVYEVGYCWVDLKPMWRRMESTKKNRTSKQSFATVTCHAQLLSLDSTEPFDQHGELTKGPAPTSERLELELRVTTEPLEFHKAASGYQSRKRMLLYKHDEDMRQEMFAIKFIETCDSLLKASGLNLKLLTFRCVPVGAKRGFIEWVPGCVPLSDVCQPFGSSLLTGDAKPSKVTDTDKYSDVDYDDKTTVSEIARAGLTKYQSFRELGPQRKETARGSLSNNPIQEHLRSVAYDSEAPYMIQKGVMDAYVKSCAGYCVITYLLGVGDRHLDNLLLHQSGHFFHCDFSYILGNDPKKYLPLRISEDMVYGMGGKESDNYAMFLSHAGAAFVTLRRHENVRVLLSLVRLMAPSALPDVSVNQDAADVLLGMRERLRLDLSDDKAISFIEQLIETSISSKMWIAVDAFHSLGKHF